MIVVVLRTKPSGLYRHRRGLGLHRVGYREGNLHIQIAKLAFHAKESPPGHGTKSSILYLHSPTVRHKYIVRLSEDPLIQDSLSLHQRGCTIAPPIGTTPKISVSTLRLLPPNSPPPFTFLQVACFTFRSSYTLCMLASIVL